MKITPHSFTKQESYKVSEENFEVVTDRKGLRYEVRRVDSGSTVAEVPYGLTPDCKKLATLFANAPKLLQVAEWLLEKNHVESHAKFLLEEIIEEIKGE